MKLLTTSAELKALRTICGDNTKLSSYVLASVSKEYFYYRPVQDAYALITRRLRDTGHTPDWSEITGDPSISEDSRRILREYEDGGVASQEKAQSVLGVLEKYKKLRSLVGMSQTIQDALQQKVVDLDSLIESTADSLTLARARGGAVAQLHHFGKNNNSSAMVKELLYGGKKTSIPTGFEGFDRENSGIFLGSLFVLGANTGGGKCQIGSTPITHADGTQVSIGSTWDNAQETETPTYNGTEKHFHTPLKLLRRDGRVVDAVGMYRTRGAVMRITLEDGRQLTGLPDHRIKVDRDGEHVWVKLKDLTISDEVLVV